MSELRRPKAPTTPSRVLLGNSPFGLVSFDDPERTSFRSADPSNVYLGGGVNGLTGSRCGDVVNASPEDMAEEKDEAGQGGAFSFIFDKIETTEKLRSVLEVSAAASYRGLSLNVGGHAEYFRSASLDKYSIKVYGRVDVKLSRQRLTKKVLSEEAKKYVGNQQRFFNRMGDYFVDQMRYGGTYFLILDYRAETQEEFESLTAGVDAAIKQYQGSGNIKQTFERAFQQKVTSAVVLSNGAINPLQVDPATMIDQMIKFPTDVKASGGVAIGFETLEVVTASGAYELDDFRYTDAEGRFEELAKVNDLLAEVRSGWRRVEKQPYLFVGGDAKSASREIEALDGMERQIAKEIKDVVIATALTYVRPENAPLYDIQGSLDRLPPFVSIYRPTIKAGYKNEDKVLKYKTINTGSLTDREDPANWVDVRSGGARRKWGLSFEFENPPPGLDLEYRLTFYRNLDPFGWVKSGVFLEDPKQAATVTGIAFRLVGPMASQYVIHYMIHCIDVGDSDYTAGNGLGANQPMGTLVSKGEWQVQGVRVIVVPRSQVGG